MAPKGRKAAAARPRYKVVIAEDSPLQRRRLEIALATQGFDVTVCENGQAALAKLRSELPDLLITDVMMPEMDGFELCNAIRADPDLAILPVILVTTLSSPRDVVRALECAADAFLPKPYTDESLFARTDYILANRDRRRHSLAHETVIFSLEGEEITIELFPQRILDLLLSAYSAAIDKEHELIQVNQELRSIKAALEELNENLEDKVNERTVRITRMLDQERLVGKVLAILNRRNEWQALIADILETIQTSTGLEAVAIRLEQEGDFPYVTVCGFPPEFVATEKSLVDCDGAGLPKRDAAGKQELACMCGNVIRGRTDPALSFFTEHGSSWTNSTTKLLASTTEKERQSPTRNQCNAFGYESVALIPIRSNDHTIGLLQLNDHRTDQFDAETIRFFEGLAASIGVAYKRQQAEERYRTLFERNMAGVYVTALDGRFIACNRAFSDMLGYASPEEMMSVHASELYFDAADREKFLGELRRAREIVGKEFRLRRKDGWPIWVLENACMIQAGNGDTAAIQGTVVDVTHLRETEETLRERVKELTCLFRVNHELQKDHSVVEMVRRVAELLGAGMTFPDKARVRVELAAECCATEGYADDLPPGIDADICTEGCVLGRLSVRYADHQPFISEEQNLLNTLAADLGMWYEHTQSEKQLKKALDVTVRAVGLTAEMKDAYTSGHQRRVAELACAVASKMGMSEKDVEEISTASLIHDIGKMRVPSEILTKPGALTDVEFSLIKEHPRVAYEMLTAVEFPEPVPTIIVQHHERLDGSGYPDGLKGEAITLAARILAVADVVEAMASHRPYRPTLGIETALAEISDKRGTLFDAEVVDACLSLFEKGQFSL